MLYRTFPNVNDLLSRCHSLFANEIITVYKKENVREAFQPDSVKWEHTRSCLINQTEI